MKMTQEEKVRNAVKVADGLVNTKHPEHCHFQIWQSIFSAMLYEPFDNRTATNAASEAESEAKGR
jgi:hypothetical protein